MFNKAILSDTTADGRAADAADKAQVYATDDFAFAVYSLDAKGIDTKATENTDYKAVDYVNGQPVVLNGANYTAADVKDGVATAKEGPRRHSEQALSQVLKSHPTRLQLHPLERQLTSSMVPRYLQQRTSQVQAPPLLLSHCRMVSMLTTLHSVQ